MEDAELRILHWLAEHDRNNPGKPVKDVDLAYAFDLNREAVHAIVNRLRAAGEVEGRDFPTAGLGYSVLGLKLTLAGFHRLAENARRSGF